LVCAVGMAVIGNSVSLGELWGDDANSDSTSGHIRALVFAIFGLWLMNLSVNVMQGPSRAIVADIVPPNKQQLGNSMVSNVMGLAAIIASIVGAQFFGTSEPYFYLFMIGIGCVLLSCVPTMIVAKEVPYQPPVQSVNMEVAEVKHNAFVSVFVKIYRGFRFMPREMLKVTALFFLSWASYSPFMIYITQWYGINVYGGDPSGDGDSKYKDGVRMGMYGLAIFAGVQWVYSFLLPHVVNRIGVRAAYFISQFIATACYVLFLFFSKSYLGFIVMGFIALNFTTFNSVPFALVSDYAKDDAGLYMGVLNSAAVVAQMVSENAAGGMVAWKNEDVSYGIAVGAIFSILACVMVFFISVPSPKVKEMTEHAPLLGEENNP